MSQIEISELSLDTGFSLHEPDVYIIKDKQAREDIEKNKTNISAEGNLVRVDDCLGGVPFNSVEVIGKNLIPHPYVDSDKTHNGIMFVNNYPFITVKPGRTTTAPGPSSFMIVPSSGIKLTNGTYVLSGCPEGGSFSTYSLCCGMKKIGQSAYAIGEYGNGTVITIDDTVEYVYFYVRVDASYTPDTDLVFEPQLELGSTATDYEPPITGREMQLRVNGKNIIPYPYTDKTKTTNGISYTLHDDGTISATAATSGIAASSNAYFSMLKYGDEKLLFPAGTYSVSGCPKNTSDENKWNIRIWSANYQQGEEWFDFGDGVTFTLVKPTYLTIACRINKGAVLTDEIVFKPMVVCGDTPSPYEKPVPVAYLITPDTNPYTIPFDIIQNGGTNTMSIDGATLKVNAVKDNPTVKSIFESPDKLLTSNGKSGNPVVIENLQGGVPFNKISVKNNNLVYTTIDKIKAIHTAGTWSGNEYSIANTTVTIQDDMTMIFNGSPTSNMSLYLAYPTNDTMISLKGGKTYCFNGNSDDTNVFIRIYSENGTAITAKYLNEPIVYTPEQDCKIRVAIGLSTGKTANNVAVKLMIAEGDIPQSYEPPITSREMTLTVTGKNLFNFPYYSVPGLINGVTFDVNKDGSIHVYGTAGTGNASFYLSGWTNASYADYRIKLDKNKTYTLKGCPQGGSVTTYRFSLATYLDDNVTIKERLYDNGEGVTFSGASYLAATFVVYPDTKVDFVIYPQLEVGTKTTEYEPPKGTTSYTITPDTNPYAAPMDIIQLDGMNVITADADTTISVNANKKNSQLAKAYNAIDKSYKNTLIEIDRHTPQLLFSGATSVDSPAVVDLTGYEMVMITYISQIGTTAEFLGQYIMAVSTLTDNYINYVQSRGASYTYGLHAKINSFYDELGYQLRIYGINQRTELKIYSQPYEGIITNVNLPYSFTVGVQGDGLTYQWQYSKDNGVTWTNTKSTAASYNNTAREEYNGYQYRCIITDKYGDSIISDVGLLTVHIPLQIVSQMMSVNTYPGNTVNLVINAKGEGLTYVWKGRQMGTSTWYTQTDNDAIKNSNTNSISYTPLESWADKTYEYYCIVTDKFGNTEESSPIIMRVFGSEQEMNTWESVNEELG